MTKRAEELAEEFKVYIKSQLWPKYGDTNFDALKEAYLSGFYAAIAADKDLPASVIGNSVACYRAGKAAAEKDALNSEVVKALVKSKEIETLKKIQGAIILVFEHLEKELSAAELELEKLNKARGRND